VPSSRGDVGNHQHEFARKPPPDPAIPANPRAGIPAIILDTHALWDSRHRTVRSKGCLSNKTALALIFKLAEAAEKSWRRLDGHNQLPKVILGIKFTDGIEVIRSQAQAAA
jgi:hypothetical protein